MGVVEAKLSVKDDAKSSSSAPPPNFSMDGAHRGLASMMPEEKPLDVVGDPEIPELADDVGFDQDPESPKKGGEEGVAAAAEKGVWPGFSQRPDAPNCAFYMKTGTCKFGLNCRFNHPPKRRHRAKPEKQSEYVQTIKAAHKGSGSEKMGQTTCKEFGKVGEKEKKVAQKSFRPENAEKKQKGTVLKKVEQTEKKVGEKEKKVAQKNFKPEDAEKKQKGTILKKVEQTEKKAVEKEEQTPSKKVDQEKVTLKKQWKVVQKAAREEHEESSLIMEVDEKEKEIAHSFMQLKCEKTEEKQKAILLRTVEQTEIKAAEDKQSFPERIEHEDKKVDILSLPEEKQTLSGRSEQQDYKAAREKGKETTSEKGEQTEFKAGTEEGKETTLGKGGLIEHKAAVEKSKETTLEKGGQIECKFYTMPGGCKYGKSCKYVHSQKKMEGNSSKLNFLGLPIRLGAKECPYYMRTGNCKFSTNCRYHHPDPTVAMVGHDPHSGCQSSGSMQQSAFGASTMPVTPSRSQGTLNGPTSFVVASPACSPASNLLSQGFHSNSECNGYQQVHIDEYPERPGQPECHYYMKNGFCPFKSVCKFDHPKSHLPTKSNGVSIPICPPQ
ncbi:zinc finger CCCH domain-containing protein 65 isoform X3 [Musa acuminata AAA Group]|uniref:zinc finger CCCH domain-containing protein 65 isoform X3 n=1 Tax=Musa acuminata AAA Group TaxID=214697 RepID=UPI0031D0D9E6